MQPSPFGLLTEIRSMQMRATRILKILIASLVGIGITILIAVWFWRPGLLFRSDNDGHRLGGDLIAEYPENTLEAFRVSIRTLEAAPSYHYSECDLRETKDHHIVLFHDWDLSRLIPDSDANRKAVGVTKIDDTVLLKDLTLAQIEHLKLAGGCRIPTLQQFLECAKELKPKKPILLELKLFHDRQTISKAIELAAAFRDETGLEIHFLAFIRNLKRSHPNPRALLDEFQKANFRVYQAYRPKTAAHDLCETW